MIRGDARFSRIPGHQESVSADRSEMRELTSHEPQSPNPKYHAQADCDHRWLWNRWSSYRCKTRSGRLRRDGRGEVSPIDLIPIFVIANLVCSLGTRTLVGDAVSYIVTDIALIRVHRCCCSSSSSSRRTLMRGDRARARSRRPPGCGASGRRPCA